MKKLVLIDGNSMVFKAFYATAHTGNLMMAADGTPTNALRPTANMVNKILKESDPSHMLVAFDASKKTFRHNLLEDYKAGRSKTPEELKKQFPLVKEYLDYLGILKYELEGYEADDIIATLAKLASSKGYIVNIYSSDKDLLQLVDDNISVFLTNKGVSNVEKITINNFEAKYEYKPDQVVDIKGLMGDSSDNLPGIAGVGQKTATKLIKEYSTLENIIENASNIRGKLSEKIIANQELGLLCKKLATLDVKSPLKITLEETKYDIKNFNVRAITNFLTKYGLNSILKNLGLTKRTQTPIDYVQINDLPVTLDDEPIAIYAECDNQNYNISNVIGIAISQNNKNYFISKQDLAKAKNLKKVLKSEFPKIVYGYQKLINNLARLNLEVNNVVFDSKLAIYLVDHKLPTDIFRVEQVVTKTWTILPGENFYGKGVNYHIPNLSSVAKHATTKSAWIIKSFNLIKEMIENDGLEMLYYQIEMPVSKILSKMEQEGILIDQDELKHLNGQTKLKIKVLEDKIYELSGHKFNIASPKQLGEILFEKLKLKSKKNKNGNYSTDNSVLSMLVQDHPVIPYIIQYRVYTKLYSTYIVGLESMILEDGKLHTNYIQTLTQTGRLSSRFPNLQNISIKNPVQKLVRKIFISKPNYSLAAFDYSQIELRILAHLANEDNLIDAFVSDRDIHTETALKIFKKEDKISRNKAKAVNFGIIYGISDFGLSTQLKIPIFEAKDIIRQYKKTFSKIEEFRLQCIEQANEEGFVKTIFNRKRFIPELNSYSHQVREFGKRAATNAPIQGTASDIIKMAMVAVDKKLKNNNLDAKLLLQVHDELIYEIADKDLKTISKIIKKEMENAVKLKVRLKVSYSIGKNLYDLK